MMKKAKGGGGFCFCWLCILEVRSQKKADTPAFRVES